MESSEGDVGGDYERWAGPWSENRREEIGEEICHDCWVTAVGENLTPKPDSENGSALKVWFLAWSFNKIVRL